MIKIWRVNDVDWWASAAETPQAVAMEYASDCGMPVADACPDGEPEALSDEQMDSLIVRETDENERPTEDGPTFRQYLDRLISRGEAFPQIFCTTEW